MKKIFKTKFPIIKNNEEGYLRVIEKNTLPINVKRVFYIKENAGAIGGNHAHILCKQYLICMNGKVELLCFDGKEEKKYTLEPEGFGVLINNGIWAQQKYLINNTILLVICDRVYEKSDYIYNFEELTSWCKEN